MENQRYALEVKGLKKRFKDKSVLNGVDFQVEKGTIFSLLGSNGAGKTTTIKILTTLLKPDAGMAYAGGYDILKDVKKIHEQISLTGQYAAVDEALSGYENLVMMGNLYHIKNPEMQAKKLLNYFSLDAFKDKRVSTYSGGMRRKLDIAMSLVHKPSIIFLDEPTTGLDPQSRRAMWNIVKSLKESGVTIFLTTQYLEEAEALADHIAILHEGKIILEGTPKELKMTLPKHVLELQLYDRMAFDKTWDILKHYTKQSNGESFTISVTFTDTINDVIDILQSIKQADIPLQDLRLKQTTIEDVFMKIMEETV